jgi:Icc-related predicted phosphoesterase
MEKLRLMYVADIHGSETVWRKWINAQSMYEIDVSILAGDLSGKVIVPIVKQEDGSYICRHEGRVDKASDTGELEAITSRLKTRGIYPYLTTQEEVDALKANPDKVEVLFQQVINDELDRLLTLTEKIIQDDKTVVVCPGNDDIKEMDKTIERHQKIINPLGKVVRLPMGYEMISMDYSNPTPWKTPRECSEDELWKKLEALPPMTSGNWKKIICNFHCPPYGTRLDLAPKLDKTLRPVYNLGIPEFINVGSTSIRKFLEKYQPILSLHGHIHESTGTENIGETMAMNPGSEYTAGILKGVIVELNESGLVNWFKIG